jgi:hypothetical protein
MFYKHGNTDIVRQKAAHKQQTEASKKSSRDFGSASRNGAYIRKAFAPLVKLYAYGGSPESPEQTFYRNL